MSVIIEMSKREQRIYFTSTFAEQDSTLGHFVVNLPLSLDLSGFWKCAIRDIYISSKTISSLDYIYILGNFCETSFVGKSKELPILKKVYLKKRQQFYTFTHPLYIPLKQKQLNSFELEFVDSNLKVVNFEEESFVIECTLHFYKHGG